MLTFVRYVVWNDLPPEMKRSRVHVSRLASQGLYPPAYAISGNRVGWREDDVALFLASRPPVGQPLPQLWPVRMIFCPNALATMPGGGRVYVNCSGAGQ